MTAQASEVLILDGEKTRLTFCPPLPFGDPRFGVSREELALRAVAVRIVMAMHYADFKAREVIEREVLNSDDPKYSEILDPASRMRARRLDAMMRASEMDAINVDSIKATSIAEALEAATDEMPETYYAGQDRLPKRTTAEELSAAVDAAREEGWERPERDSSCWRGYQGTWEIRDDRFYLVEVAGTPSYMGRAPILADWFTGVLRIPRGEMLAYRHMGFASQYEAELHIKVERGVVKERRLLSARDLASRSDPRSVFEVGLPGTENRFPGDDEI